MPQANVNGVEIHYETQGDGTPALFIHGGFGGAQSTLAAGPNEISDAAPLDRVRLITYDRRCAGLSEYALDEAFTLDDVGADARALLAHLDIDRAIIIGSSMGGMVALQYALSYPETVHGLALLNTGVDLMSDMPMASRLVDTARRVKREGAEAVFESTKGELRNPPPLPQRQREAAAAARMAATRERYLKALEETSDEDLFTYWRGSVRNQAAFIGYDFAPRLGEIDAPTLVVHGNADSVVPFGCGEELRDGIAGAEFHAIDGADHGIVSYQAARTAICDWLGGVA